MSGEGERSAVQCPRVDRDARAGRPRREPERQSHDERQAEGDEDDGRPSRAGGLRFHRAPIVTLKRRWAPTRTAARPCRSGLARERRSVRASAGRGRRRRRADPEKYVATASDTMPMPSAMSDEELRLDRAQVRARASRRARRAQVLGVVLCGHPDDYRRGEPGHANRRERDGDDEQSFRGRRAPPGSIPTSRLGRGVLHDHGDQAVLLHPRERRRSLRRSVRRRARRARGGRRDRRRRARRWPRRSRRRRQW